MSTITDNQIGRLAEASNSIAVVVEELGGGESVDVERVDKAHVVAVAEPQWVGEYRRTYRFLKELEERGGSVTPEELSTIARRNGYDPRGTGGYYRGKGMLRRAGNKRELSTEGRRYLHRWAPEFGTEGDS